VTSKPTSEWVIQQLRQTFSDSLPYRFVILVILDRDSKFDPSVIQFLKSSGLTPKRTSVEAYQRTGALAKRDRGTLDRQLPPGASRSCDRNQ
jgi:hypothetical protein